MGDDWVNGVNLLEIKDELTLHEMLDRSEDYEDRKKVRSRLKDVIAASRAKREELISHREADREEVLRARVRDADENKRRTLAMYDAMAKSAPAGGNKTMDINILREGKSSTPSTPGAVNPAPRVDLVEQAIRQRQADADDRKKRTLMAYDNAAKSGPAGAARFIDFEAVIKKEDLQNYDPNQKNNKSSTFQMFGGVPLGKQGPAPVVRPMAEQPRDIMEESIRKRQAESDARKARTLAAYDKAAKSRPAGVPVTVYIPQEGDMEPVVDVVSRSQRGMVSMPMTPPPVQRKIAAPSPPPTVPNKPYAPTPVYRQAQFVSTPPASPQPQRRSSPPPTVPNKPFVPTPSVYRQPQRQQSPPPTTPNKPFVPTPVYRQAQFASTPPGSPQPQHRYQTQIQFQPPSTIQPPAPTPQPIYQQQFSNTPPGSPQQPPRYQTQAQTPTSNLPATFAQPVYQQQFTNSPPDTPQQQPRYQSQLQFQPQSPSQAHIPPYQNQPPGQGYTPPFYRQPPTTATNQTYRPPAYQSQHPSLDQGTINPPNYQRQQQSVDQAYNPPSYQTQQQTRTATSSNYYQNSQESRTVPIQIYNNVQAPKAPASRYYGPPGQTNIEGPSKSSPSFTVPQNYQPNLPQVQQQRYQHQNQQQQQQTNQQRQQQQQQQQQQQVQRPQAQQQQQQNATATFKVGGTTTQQRTTTTTTTSSKQQYYEDESEEEEEEEESE